MLAIALGINFIGQKFNVNTINEMLEAVENPINKLC